MPHRQHINAAPTSRQNVSLLAVDRAVHEMRRGRPVVITAGDGACVLALAAEALSPKLLKSLIKTSGNEDVKIELAITRRRAIRLGLGGDALGDDHLVLAVSIPDTQNIDELAIKLARLADPMLELGTDDLIDCSAAVVRACSRHGGEAAAVGLAKIARLLPAAVVVEIGVDEKFDVAGWAARNDIQLVDGGDVFQHERTTARTLRRVSEAVVPLEGTENTRIIAYRPIDGGVEHLAIVIGDPENITDAGDPVLVRLHSECFTGDLLGSLRCDCGDQLRGAISEIGKVGTGVLLYLAQEGRGIGLVNKLRAYTLQDGGLDTLDANEELGFDTDERVYLPAAQMLKDLGLLNVRLLTNNPEKVSALSSFGIGVVERVAHKFPSNKHNERYLETKASKGGHLF